MQSCNRADGIHCRMRGRLFVFDEEVRRIFKDILFIFCFFMPGADAFCPVHMEKVFTAPWQCIRR